jgi:hypothetical protein
MGPRAGMDVFKRQTTDTITIKSKTSSRMGHTVCMEDVRNSHKNLLKIPDGKRITWETPAQMEE